MAKVRLAWVMTLQGSGRCRTLPGPARPVAGWLQAKVDMPRFCVVGWENWSFLWSRAGVLFSDFFLCSSFCSFWETRLGRFPRAREIRAASSGWSLHGTRALEVVVHVSSRHCIAFSSHPILPLCCPQGPVCLSCFGGSSSVDPGLSPGC